MFCYTIGIYECKTALHKDKQKDIAERETNMEMMEAILGVISRQSLWTVVQSPVKSGESPVQSGKSPVQNGDHQFKMAITSSKRQMVSLKWPSPVQSGGSYLNKSECAARAPSSSCTLTLVYES